jgi:hypothetical protein
VCPGSRCVSGPVILFFAMDGQQMEILRGPVGSSFPSAGSPVGVSYNPADPADARDLAAGSFWERPFYTGAVGLALLLLLAVLMWPRLARLTRQLRQLKAAQLTPR